MMKKQWIIALGFGLMAMACRNSQNSNDTSLAPFYLGTYTDGESQGIYEYGLDPDGHLKSLGLRAEVNNPSYLAFGNNQSQLLCVSEEDREGTGAIQSFDIKKDTLLLLATSESGGAHPCFVAVDKDGHVVVANYNGGNTGWLQLGHTGLLSNLLFVGQHEGAGPTDRQKAPHPHSAWFVGDDVIALDLGTDQLWVYTKDAELKYKVDMAAGAGPRHLCIHPGGKWIYVVNELNGTVTRLTDHDGVWERAESISTLPEDFKGVNTCADIHITKDGRFLYASNRGHNSIALFSVGSGGTLKALGYEPVRGDHPRNFTLSPDENYLLVANKNTNNIVSFKRDSESGLLSFVDEIGAPSPVCILFK